MDGIDDNDAYYGETVINSEGVQGTPATHLPIDAIQEFSVQQSPEAEYGWKPGAVVNLGIKSGTNDFHGSVYYFNRNSAYDARNYFNPEPQPASALNLNEYGASLGGPIIKNKLFFFANYEGVQDKVGNPLELNTPVTVSNGDPSSSIPDAIAYCQDPSHGCPLNAIGLQMAKLYPSNAGGAGSDPTLIPFDFNNTNSENNGIAKVDYHLSDHHQFSARYFQGRSIQTEEDVNVLNPAWLSQADTHAQVFGVTWAWTPKSNFANQVRFGYNNFWQQLFTADHNVPPSAYGLDTGITTPLNYGLTQVRVSGFNNLGGNSSWPLLTVPNKTYQITETASWTVGRHALKFGGEFRTGSTSNTRDTYGKGRVDFRSTNVDCDADPENGCDLTSLEALVSGNYRNGRVFEGDSQRNVSQKSFGFFVQDNWRATPRLTISAGLRWDVSLPITADNNLIGNFQAATGLQQVGQQISQPYNTDWNNFAPRLGFAYDMFGDGKTVLRAGAGIIYEIPHISLYISQNNADALGLATIPTAATGDNGQKLTPNGTIAASTVIQNTLDFSGNGPIFGSISPTAVSCTSDDPCSILGVEKNIRTPYVVNWNLNIQHAFTNTTSLQIAYVGNKGTKLYSIRDTNQNNYANDVDQDGQSGRPLVNQYPYLSYVDMLQNKDDSIYNGLQVSLTQRTYKGLDIIASYTWAHAIDMASSNRGYVWEDAYNGYLERGNADSDIRHRGTIALTYTTPTTQKWNALLGNWQLNSIVTLETAAPIDLYDSSDDLSGTDSGNDRWNIYGSASNIKLGLQGIPFFAAGTDDNGNQYGDPRCLSIAQAQGSIDSLNYVGGCFIQNGTILIPQAFGQFGTMRRNQARGFPFTNVDFSVGKFFKLSERFNLQLRAEFFNIFNHVNFAGADADLSDGYLGTVGIPIYTPDVAAANPVVGSGGSRHIQFAAKIIF